MAEAEPAQVPVTFEDIAVYFCKDEWEMLAEWQKELYRETMKENYEILASLDASSEKPSLISKIEWKEEPCVRDQQDLGDRRRLKSSWRDSPAEESDLAVSIKQEEDSCVCDQQDPRGSRQRESSCPGCGIHHENKKHHKECVENLVTNKMLLQEAKEGSEEERDQRSESHSNKERESPAKPKSDTDSISGYLTITNKSQTSADQKLSPFVKWEENIKRQERLIAHKLRYAREQHFQCAECGKILSSKSFLRMHWRVHERKVCRQEVGRKKQLAQHQRICAKRSNLERLPLGGKPFPCLQCGKSFNYKSHLKFHYRIHMEKKSFICSECGKSFNDESHLKAHKRIHTGDNLFTCSECGKSFIWKSYLKIHQRIHTGDKPFACTECDKRFNQKSHLDTHQWIHTGEKPFICTECNKSFNNKSCLRVHQRRHTGEKPFSCSECQKRFNQKSHLQAHQRIHTGDKPFTCLECSKSFNDKSHLKRHQHIHTRSSNK